MRVMVTGGNGFVGSAVVGELLDRGHEVRCLVRERSDCRRLGGRAIEKVVGDVRDVQSLKMAAQGTQAVVHLACLSSWSELDSPLLEEVAIEGTRHVVDAALLAGCRRLVFVSSIAAVGATSRPIVQDEETHFSLPPDRFRYACAKAAGEAICFAAQERGLQVVVVNPGEVYGPGDVGLITASTLVDFARSWLVLVCSGGTNIVHVDDVARGIVAALERGRSGERYILGGDNVTIAELARLTLDLVGQSHKWRVRVPSWLLRAAAALARLFHLPFPVPLATVPYATRYWMMSSRKAKEELQVSFRNARSTLSPTIDWLCKSGLVQASKEG